MNSAARSTWRVAGFTLIEAVVAMTLTGILVGIVAIFIKTPVEGYLDSVRRADLTDAADAALRRLTRDVRTALPNSLRGAGTAGSDCFEFLPTVGGGRYRASPNGAGTGNVFNFTTTNGFGFDVLADSGLGSLPAGTNHVVVYNLGLGNADAYDGGNRRPIQSVTGASPNMTVQLVAGSRFPFDSPGKRFQVIPDYAVVYSCVNGRLLRSTRPISTAPMSSCPTAGTLLTGDASCSFSYMPAVSQRHGLLTATLTLTRAGESVQLYQEIHVNNVP